MKIMRQNLKVIMHDGTPLIGVRFHVTNAKTVFIALTGVGGNINSNRFYTNIGKTLNNAGIDFIVAHALDAFDQVKAVNEKEKEEQIYGADFDDFQKSDDEVDAYLAFAQQHYEHILLGGQSLGANKVIHYLANNPDSPIEKFILMSPINIDGLRERISGQQRKNITDAMRRGKANEWMPFKLFRWQKGIYQTGWRWLTDNTLNNTSFNFTQLRAIKHTGALLIGTHDGFTRTRPTNYLKNINKHMKNARKNRLIFIKDASHVYRGKEQEVAAAIMTLITKDWNLS